MIDEAHPLLLASASPRRRDIVASLQIPVVVRAVEVDERLLGAEDARAYLERVVAAKLRAAGALPEASRTGATLVADTVVVLDGRVLGKPENRDEARRMLGALAGRGHEVLTRLALGAPEQGSEVVAARTVETRVWFRPLGAGAIERYVASGEGDDKAGSYAIQGLGAFLVRGIEGSYSNVVGLPSADLVELLCEAHLLPHFPLGGAV